MEITVKDFRRALQRVEQNSKCTSHQECPCPQEAFLFKDGLKQSVPTRNIKMEGIIAELGHKCHVKLPAEIYKVASDNSDKEMVNAINQYIHELENYDK